jgi:hypothetical protein
MTPSETPAPAATAFMPAALNTGARPVRGEHRFFSIASLAMIAVIAVGFAPSFYLRGIIPAPHPFEPLTPLVLLHGLLFTAFLMLFTTQVWLVAAGRSDVHRKLGRVAFILVPVMIVVGVVTGLGGVSRPLTAPPGISPLSWLAVPLLDVPVFGTLLILGLANRFRPVAHKRYMFIAMADMMVPGFGRIAPLLPIPRTLVIPTGQIFLPALFLMALIAWDYWSRGRPHRISIIATSAVIAVAAVKPLVWTTSAWLHFAEWVSTAFR